MLNLAVWACLESIPWRARAHTHTHIRMDSMARTHTHTHKDPRLTQPG